VSNFANMSASDSPTSPRPAGLAGLDAGTTQQLWGDESRHLPKTPGGFEWWHFHSINHAGDGIHLTLFEGLPFHPYYVTDINRHSRRLIPSAFDKLSPDLQGSHYPAAHLAVYQGGKRVTQFLYLYPPYSVAGGSGESALDLRIGPNRLTMRQDGSFGIVARGYPFELVRGRPYVLRDQVLSAQLTFAPSFPGVVHNRPFRPPTPDGATYTWSLAAPHGQMSGRVQLLDQKESISKLDVLINAIGYHDHVWGSASLAAGIREMFWGFLQGDTWTVAWHQAIGSKGSLSHAEGLVFFERGAAPIVVDGPIARLEKRTLSRWLIPHYGRRTMHGSTTHGHSAELVLNNHTLVDAAPFHSGLATSGTLTIPGVRSCQGSGMTHALKLQRLQWPVLSDMTLQAITEVSEDDPVWHD
jgi:hypothetical protein